jgi:hypothetical protein
VLIYLFHPALGLLATASVVYLMLLAWANERVTRDTIARLQDGSRQAARFVDNALRNAEVVTALGMPGAVTRRWNELIGRNHALQIDISRLGGLVGSLSRTSRQLIQIVMLGFGAYLVIHEGATPGVMLATTIILARALAPVEQLIGGWKGLVEARASLHRLREALARPTEGAVGTELPRPTGRLSVEGVVYTRPAPSGRCCGASRCRRRPGPCWPWWARAARARPRCAAAGRRDAAGGGRRAARRRRPCAAGTRRASAPGSATCRRRWRCSTAASPTTSRGSVRWTPSPCCRRRATRRRTSWCCGCRAATTRRSARTAAGFPAASGSAWHWRARCTGTRRWSCWTSPTPASTPRASRRCWSRCAG